MVKREYSPRCLQLTEDIISQNPAHYTVWLYRFSIINALGIPIQEEITWLNQVSLEHLKNYQIWHHRHLLLEKYYPSIASSPEKVAQLGRSEREFLAQMFAEDAKNYHVWSYRQYLVQLLGMWNGDELASVEEMIEEDVRNNSAWSHRFYLVFSDPKQSTPGAHSTEHDPAVPGDVIDREMRYTEDKIKLAPQNQSPWNYLKGVLTKGGRKLSAVEGFAAQYVTDLGKEGSEDVKSSHALDLLAEIYAEQGDKKKAGLALRRLAEKWDRIRAGYWDWRSRELGV
jgi:protein farnesyltransferase/geranylgeranyltransferase type-1 subunit alpha